MTRTLSIIIPVYNEAHTISRVLEAAEVAPLPNGVERELIVVNDGSYDGTFEVLNKYADRAKFKIVHLPENRGKGFAIRAGIPNCSGDWILIQDGDLEYDISAYFTIVTALSEGRAKVVYGSRFLGTIEQMGWPYRLVNWMLTHWTNFLFGTSITDEATAYKAFDTKLLKEMKLSCRRFEFCPEVTGKLARRKISIYEVPVRYRGRDKAQGKKIRWYDAFQAFWVLFRERFFSA